jgi:multidrug resistance efflux pump
MQLEFNRSQDLRKQKLISQADFDRAGANLKAAQARKTAAEANLEQADEQLDRTVMRAPYSGVVVERHVEPGEAVNPGQPIMTGYAIDYRRFAPAAQRHDHLAGRRTRATGDENHHSPLCQPAKSLVPGALRFTAHG